MDLFVTFKLTIYIIYKYCIVYIYIYLPLYLNYSCFLGVLIFYDNSLYKVYFFVLFLEHTPPMNVDRENEEYGESVLNFYTELTDSSWMDWEMFEVRY